MESDERATNREEKERIAARRAATRAGLVSRIQKPIQKEPDPEELEIAASMMGPEDLMGKTQSQSRILPTIFIVVGSILGLAVIGGIIASILAEPDQNPSTPIKTFAEIATAAEIEEEAKKAVRGFIESQSHAERAKFIVNGENLIPAMTAYYQREGVSLPLSEGEISVENPTAASGIVVYPTLVRHPNLIKPTPYTVISVEDGMRIDWESTVSYCEIPWSEFISRRPTEAVTMRVYLIRLIDEDNNKEDSSEVLYQVTNKSMKGFCLAVAPHPSQIGNTLEDLIKDKELRPVTIRLRFVEGQKAAVIEEIVHDTWLNPDRHPKANSRESE